MPSFYAVKAGRVPGVYSTWDKCEEQVTGYPGAKYKKCKHIESAQAFVNQPPSPTLSTTGLPFDPHLHELIDLDSERPEERDERVDRDLRKPIKTKKKRLHEVDDEALNDGDAEILNEEATKKQPRVKHLSATQPRLEISEHSSEQSAAVEKDSPGLVEPRESKPSKKKRKIDDQPSSAASSTPIITLDSDTKAFFTSLNYRNPAAFARLAETGFGAYELLSMRGLSPGAISSRFRILLGDDKPQLAAQIESLAFAVWHATDAFWTELEGRLLVSRWSLR